MIVSEGARSQLGSWMWICSKTGVLPFSWDKKLGQVTLSQNQWKSRCHSVVRFTLAIYVVYYAYQHWATLFSSKVVEATSNSRFLAFVWVAIYISGYFWGLGNISGFWKNKEMTAGYLNAILVIDANLKAGTFILAYLRVSDIHVCLFSSRQDY